MTQRNETITIAKAFAIMMMVAAHSGIYWPASQFIYMFHMPLFFFCSGYCFKTKYLNDARSFIFRRIKGLYIPCVKWSLLFIIMHNVFFNLYIYDDQYGFNGTASALYSYTDFAKRIFRAVFFMGGHEQLLGGFWFLRSLLVASILGFIVIRWIPRKAIGGGILLIISMLGYHINNDEIARDAMAAVFFVVGHWFSSHRMIGPRTAFTAFFIVLLGAFLLPHGMFEQRVSSVIPYTFVAVMGSTMVLWVSKECDLRLKNGLFRHLLILIGDHTLEILTWHFLCFKLVSLIVIWVEQRPIEQLAYFPVIPAANNTSDYFTPWWPLYFIVGVGVPLLFVIIHNHLLSRKNDCV